MADEQDEIQPATRERSTERQPERSERALAAVGWRYAGTVLSRAAIATTFAIAARTLAIADGNPQTALALLQHGATASIAVGTVITSIPWLCTAGGIAWLITRRTKIRHRDVAIALAAVFVAPVATPWTYLIGGIAVFAVWTVVHYAKLRPDRKTARWWRDMEAPFAWFVPTAAVVVFSLLDPRVWLPVEEVTIEGHESVVGYVLSDDNDRTVVLREDDRQVQVFNSPWTDRYICNPGGFLHRSMVPISLSIPTPMIERSGQGYPDCS